jgi:O-antigen/teichoic acid export membrane protein
LTRTLVAGLSRAGSLERTVAAGAAGALVLQVGGAAAKYATHVAFARWSDPASFGVYAYAMAWAHVLAIAGSLGLATGVLRFLPGYLAAGDWSLARGLLAWSRLVVLATATAVGLAFVGFELMAGRGAPLVPLIALAPLTAIAFVQGELLRAMRHVTAAYAPTLILGSAVATALGAAWAAVVGVMSAANALWLQAIAAAVVVAVQWGLIRAITPPHVRRQTPSYEPRHWLAVSLPLLAMSGFVIVLGQIDVIMLGLLRDPVEVGNYSAASRTAGLVGLALMAANAVVAPMISEFHQTASREDLSRVVTTGTRLALAGSLATALVLAVAGEEVLSLFGAGYEGGYIVVMVLAAAHVVSAGAGPVGYLMSLTGHEKAAARVYGLCTLGNVVLNVLLIPAWGPLGAAIAAAMTMVTWNVWLRLLVNRRLGMGSGRPWGLVAR